LTSLVLARSHTNRGKLVAAHPSGEGPLAEIENEAGIAKAHA